MTETGSQQADRIFKKAAIIAGFPFGNGWPEYFSHEQLARLMAGGPEDTHPVDCLYWRKMIADATVPTGSLKFKDEVSKTIEPVRWNPANERPTFAGMPARLVFMCQGTGETFRYCFIDREACTAWLRAIGATPSEYVRAWLGDAWQEEAPKVGAGKTAPAAADSRPGERQAYFRGIWIELDKPVRNHSIWQAIYRRAGNNGCPITSATGTKEFVFQYSDGGTDRLDKSQFQKDMSAVRAAERKG